MVRHNMDEKYQADAHGFGMPLSNFTAVRTNILLAQECIAVVAMEETASVTAVPATETEFLAELPVASRMS